MFPDVSLMAITHRKCPLPIILKESVDLQNKDQDICLLVEFVVPLHTKAKVPKGQPCDPVSTPRPLDEVGPLEDGHRTSW